MPTELIVADFFVYASVPFAEHCLKDAVAYTKGKKRGGGSKVASERGAGSKVANKWARWLHNPCRLGGPHRFRAGGTIRGGPEVGKVAT